MGQGMAAKEPAGIEEITKGYLSDVAGKMLGDRPWKSPTSG
jgi:hypothetical protein